jgi:glycosyltransferase involved in cell wall biosynthesis
MRALTQERPAAAGAKAGYTCQVSAILPVYNEARYIGTCLASLLKQVGCTFEILVVNDGSTDATPAIVRQFAARDRRVVLLRQDHLGPGKARNMAAEHARGAILAFCDADMAFAPDYLATLIAPIEHGEAVGTFSKEEFVANWDNIWARCWNLNDGIATNKRHPEDWPDQHEVFRAVGRNAFLAAQGFSSRGSGDDSTLAAKIGALAQAVPGAVCYHYNPESLGEAFHSARWYARGRRIPATWRNIWTHTPLMSLKSSVKRALAHRMPAFLLFKAVVDTGILVGLIEKRLGLADVGR